MVTMVSLMTQANIFNRKMGGATGLPIPFKGSKVIKH